MAVDRFPGEFRVGVLNEAVDGVRDTVPKTVGSKILLMCLLSGSQKFTLGLTKLTLSSEKGPQAILLRLNRPLQLCFSANRGEPLTKIAIAAPPEWLETFSHSNLDGLVATSDGLHHYSWSPSATMMGAARTVAESETGMKRMSLGLELLHQALSEYRNPTAFSSACLPDKHIAQARQFIQDNLHRRISSQDVAQGCGVGLRTLQRLFEKSVGCSLGAHIKISRINVGREALERDGLSVAQAAFRAGYSTPANFATAFKQTYGVPPSECRPGQI